MPWPWRWATPPGAARARRPPARGASRAATPRPAPGARHAAPARGAGARRREYVRGVAEVIKAGFIADPAVLDLVESDPGQATVPAGPAAAELIERAVRVKAAVVSKDLREAGRREFLNYGHT